MTAACDFSAPSASNQYRQPHVELLLDSYQRWLQRPLLSGADRNALGQQAYQADCVLLSHTADDDPLFNYANLRAQQLFEFEWAELIGMPSRYSAEPVNREQRERLLAQVTAHGYIADYSGVRIAKSGRRFMIRHAVVWNLHDADGVYRGQAASFCDWEFLE